MQYVTDGMHESKERAALCRRAVQSLHFDEALADEIAIIHRGVQAKHGTHEAFMTCERIGLDGGVCHERSPLFSELDHGF